MSDKPQNPTCTHPWHKADDEEPYCPACGVRTDGQMTLANMPMSVMMLQLDITLQRGDEEHKGRVTQLDPSTGATVGDRVIPQSEFHDWIITSIPGYF